MIQQQDLREQIASLLNGDVSLAAFERWLGSRSWNMFNEDSPDVVRMIAATNLRVSELHDRIIDDREFLNELRSLLNYPVVIDAHDVPAEMSLLSKIKTEISFKSILPIDAREPNTTTNASAFALDVPLVA
jgi:hypothetical protein